MFTAPMLASPMPNLKKNPKAKPLVITPGEWVAEEKYDGQRIGLEINKNGASLFTKTGVTAWTRYGNQEFIPHHIREAIDKLPDCYIDGELVAPGKRSFGTMDHSNRDELVFFAFDILTIDDTDYTNLSRDQRRDVLKAVLSLVEGDAVRLAEERDINSMDDVLQYRDEVWERDGEGLILKRRADSYQIGKRSKSWVKIKKLNSAVLTVTGFEESRGTINYRGKHAIVCLVDDDGYSCTVKTKNDVEIARLDAEWANSLGKTIHPRIGTKLRIEFQERTPDGQYREPRWDRWEDE